MGWVQEGLMRLGCRLLSPRSSRGLLRFGAVVHRFWLVVPDLFGLMVSGCNVVGRMGSSSWRAMALVLVGARLCWGVGVGGFVLRLWC